MRHPFLYSLAVASLFFFSTALPLAAPLPAQSLADEPRVADALRLIEVWVEAQRAYEDIPGISMGVVHDQNLIWSKGFGYADLERKTPSTPQTIYSICSISKLFTSIALMQQRDRGRVRLDDPVEKHLSWFDIQRAHPEAPPVRVEGLLTHSAGLPREADYPYWSGPDFPFPTRDEVMQRLASQETLYPAERYFQYSNLGLTLAGEIVAEVSEQPYDEYVRENILDPLGMDDTSPEIPEAHRGNRLATGYGRRMPGGERETVPFYLVRGVAPAAGFASTVEDLARFASWQFRLRGKGGDEVLDANTLREMQRVHWVDPDWETTWGLGFAVWRDDDKTFVGHGGSCPGYRTQLLMQPEDEVAIVFMSNANDVDTGRFARRAYEIVAPAIQKALDESGSGDVKPADPELQRYVGTYRSFWGDAAVVPWGGGLAMVSLPTENPLEALSKLERVDEHTFRRIRDDDEPGEIVAFEMGPDGQAVRLTRHSNAMERVR